MRTHTGAKVLVAAGIVASSIGIAWAAFNENNASACAATMQPVLEARSNALRAVELAVDLDEEARDAAAMALQRWQATLERATRSCGWTAN